MSQELLNHIHALEEKAISRIEQIISLSDLEIVRLLYLGKRGIIRTYFNRLKEIHNQQEKCYIGASINALRDKLDSLIISKVNIIKSKATDLKVRNELSDITLPIRPEKIGRLHPISKIIHDIKFIFASIGFKTVYGPDIEDEFHVFDALNTPSYHPAREAQDTFYLKYKIDNKRMMLRPHTSSVQIRIMKNQNNTFPIQIVAPGRVYRNDYDITHTPMFHQIEGLYVNTHVNMGHLKFTINYFLKKFFADDKTLKIRFRSSFFPFTEPSIEIDIRYKGSPWIEILGCGMIHTNVLKNVGIDPTQYTGFAFGIGIERLAMLKYEIKDIRNFYDNKIKWLNHYGSNFLSLRTAGL
ncbi:phenylalanine--tRNA ligase subunit alpha [Wolbachia endosymbiont of Howardula sp.]|uniref:phenylalanine--tRNA ligase subunit alpha n=1 Tax=Wolbachia endosymbiont of Howardula sp. TaxID=2916816 RepID=UPI00217EF559|nr:phenylalanine--tRNA ligase subunit alpha [Wolbachia endosymbiont of Howardula sp.]UWI83193.1 phenylalanine--tRNA ligase subunit alpha [Wolbachia endosymbiont of Howardula sp.]